MSKSSEKNTSRVPHIPVEVGLQIALHLDLDSARNFALVCKDLRDIGEARIWSCLDLTSGLDEAPNFTLELARSPLRVARVDSKLYHILDSLSKYPSRESHVKSIKLEISDGPEGARATALIELLARFASRIERLELLPRPAKANWNDGQKADFGHSQFMDTLNLAEIPFSKVISLRFGCGSQEGEPRRDLWLSRFKRVEELHIYSSEGYKDAHITIPPLYVFKNLKRLKFDHISRGYKNDLSILTGILGHTPKLETLWLKGEWEPNRSDPAIIAMDKLEKLRTLFICEKDWDAKWGYMEKMRWERYTPVFGRLEQVVKHEPGWDETKELSIEKMSLPRLPNAKRITILIGPRPTLEEYKSLPLGLTTAVNLLPGWVIRKLRRFPLVTHMLLLYLESPFSSDPYREDKEPVFFISPDRWEKEGHRGVIIRDYRDFSSTDDSEALWHMRTLSRCTILPNGQAYINIKRSWQDQTNYKGRAVPRDILQSAYKAAGLDMAWIEGGRDMSFGNDDSGWNILRDWRESVRSTDRYDEDMDDGSAKAGRDNWSPPPSVDEFGDDDDGGHFMMGPHLNEDGVYEDDDGVFDDEDYDAHEPYYGYDTYGDDEDEEDFLF